MTGREHVPVLLEEAVAALAIRPDGTYVDATFGRGGQARAILERARARRAPHRVRPRSRQPSRGAPPIAIRASVRRALVLRAVRRCSAARGVERVDGVLFDLGVSSPQIDDPARGFSFRADGPLDMRMDPTRGESAAAFLARGDGARTHGGDTRLW